MNSNPFSSYLLTRIINKDYNNITKMLQAIPEVVDEILREASDLKPNSEAFKPYHDLINAMSYYDTRAKELSDSEPWVVYSMFYSLLTGGSLFEESKNIISTTYRWSANPIKMVFVLGKWVKRYEGKGYRASVKEVQVYNNDTLSVSFTLDNLFCTKTKSKEHLLTSYAFEHTYQSMLQDNLWYNYVTALKNKIKEEEVAT